MKNIIKITDKKAQQEIVGFIIIVLMVVIAGVIFLSISLRPHKTVIQDDVDMSNFLISTSRFTSECYIPSTPRYQNLDELTKICRNSQTQMCDNKQTACDVLNKSYSEILGKIWKASSVGSVTYYQLQIYYQANISDPNTRQQPPLVNIISGNLSGCITHKAAQRPQSISGGVGVLITQLDLCKGA